MSQALIRKQAVQLETIDDVQRLGEVLARSGFFSDASQAAQACVKVLAGRELGIGPVAAMTGIHVIKGKVTLSANLLAAAVRRSGRYNYLVRKLDNEGCAIEFFEEGKSIGTSEFTKQDAQQAGLTGNQQWKTFPRNMLFARALSNGVRWFCPDAVGTTAYTPEEMAGIEDAEGEIIEAASEPARVIPMPAQPQAEVIEAEPVEAATPVEYCDRETALAIARLWPSAGPVDRQTGKVTPMTAWLEAKAKVRTLGELTAERARRLLEELQKRALAKAEAEAASAAAAPQERKPDGLDQWKCSRATAMAVLQACEKAEAAGITEADWRAQMPAGIASRKDLSEEQARDFVELLNLATDAISKL
ncbi:MAG TPA: hypothetical protein VNQ79_06760 [Blastocatellia bacterium]|nr:hypothetical protein [Blastocatellia bacterium]